MLQTRSVGAQPQALRFGAGAAGLLSLAPEALLPELVLEPLGFFAAPPPPLGRRATGAGAAFAVASGVASAVAGGFATGSAGVGAGAGAGGGAATITGAGGGGGGCGFSKIAAAIASNPIARPAPM